MNFRIIFERWTDSYMKYMQVHHTWKNKKKKRKQRNDWLTIIRSILDEGRHHRRFSNRGYNSKRHSNKHARLVRIPRVRGMNESWECQELFTVSTTSLRNELMVSTSLNGERIPPRRFFDKRQRSPSNFPRNSFPSSPLSLGLKYK